MAGCHSGKHKTRYLKHEKMLIVGGFANQFTALPQVN
jgi:hypothetical protein